MKRIKVSQVGMITVLAHGLLLAACGARGLTVGIEDLGEEESDLQTQSLDDWQPVGPTAAPTLGPTAAPSQVPPGETELEPPSGSAPVSQDPNAPSFNAPVGPTEDAGVHKFLCLKNQGLTTCYATCKTDENCPERTKCVPLAADASFCLPADETFTPSGPSTPD